MGVFQTEGNHAGEFIVSEESIDYRDKLTVGVSGVIKAGTVLGTKIKTPATVAVGADNVGDGVMGAVVVSAAGGAQVGDYILTVTAESGDAGTFVVKDPSGAVVGTTGTVAVEFAEGGLTFTLADGAEDFDVGDLFVMTVSGEELPVDLTASDGSQIASGVLFDNVDTTSAAVEAVVINKDCVLNGQEIVLPSGITSAETNVLVQQLADIGVEVKGA